MNPEGMIIKRSVHTARETIDLAETILKKKGAKIYARIDQQAEAATGNIKLGKIEYLLFGNPAVGGQLMAVDSRIALDLPLKLIAWEDNAGATWVAYNDAAYLEQRYSLKPQLAALADISSLIEAVTR
ncbi:DUF302 domain-containing protein [Taibaiella soli]|uniref:DUF302 domain-containing protein n=1 Tax=Taibaiella soli TaxID=1649169 RepID=A0A2W2AKC4_9BACT|nr:DUF302 domain-containing protein [Taibaiella soli]PZF72710.1 DUF302 domain-containing protein [Taibaiella soli]